MGDYSRETSGTRKNNHQSSPSSRTPRPPAFLDIDFFQERD
ncbi:unnamed protein product [Nyctereutes procyonoides]|uniref:(raccoon dog) hypothetical protein n=1 Tax=Nyctereutes procyonoides TaxID=34880 RepID=A0A811Y2V6_NYCPR|nr:unnamed protein product [Nyctereutes procyonoides]